MESAAYNSKDDLYDFLRKFLPTNEEDPLHASETEDAGRQAEVSVETAAEPTQGICTYCGMPATQMSMSIGSSQDNICLLCKEELIQQRELFYQIVDETIRNVKYMYSIPWDKNIRVQKCSELDPKTFKVRKKKKAPSTWLVKLEPQFVQAEMDDARGMCTFKIRTGIPAAIVAASAAYTAAYACLHLIAEIRKLDRERMTGLSYWYMVHYLYCMDYERYGYHYNQVIERLIPKSGVILYRELREKRRNPSSQVFSILQDLALARQQEED